MQQTSKLSIVVDTRGAKQQLAEFSRQLNEVTKAADNMAARVKNSLSSLDGASNRAASGAKNLSGALKDIGDLSSRSFSLATRAAGRLSPLLNTTAQSSKALSTSIRDVGASSRSLAPLAGTVSRLSSSFDNTNRSARNLAGTINILNQTTNNTTIIINNVTGASRRASSGLDDLSRSANRADRASRGLLGTMNKLYTVLNSGMVAVTGLGFVKVAADMQNLNNQIRLVTDSEREYLGMKKLAIDVANENFADIGATINLYQRSARALESLGKSQADTIKFTEAVSLAMRTGGRSAGENAAAILQLGQAMGAGVIMGDEFRSISENAPVLLKLVAKEMGVLQGDLKKLSAEGKITAEIMFNAMTKNMEELEVLAEKMPLTMGQAFTVARNRFKEYTDQMMNSTGGVSDKISGMLLKVSENFDTIAKVSIAGMSLALVGLTAKIVTATNAMKLFNLVTSSNPLILVTTLFLTLTSAIYGTNEVLTLSGILVRDLYDEVKDMLGRAGDKWEEYSQHIEKWMGFATDAVERENEKQEKSFFSLYKGTEEGFAGLIQHIGTNIGSATALFGTFFEVMGRWVDNVIIGFDNMGKAAYNAGVNVRNFFGGDGETVEYQSLKSLNAADIYKATYKSNADYWRKWASGANLEAGITTPDNKIPLANRSRYAKGFMFSNVMNPNSGQYVYQPKRNQGLIANNAGQFNASTNAISEQSKYAYELKKIQEQEEERAKVLEKQRKELEKQNKAANKGLRDRLVGVSGDTGVGTAHLHIQYRDKSRAVSAADLARFKANGKSIESYGMTSGFGKRNTGIKGASTNHRGTDYGIPKNTPITTNVAVDKVRTWYDKKGGGYVSSIDFADGVKIDLLHQMPSVMGVEKGISTGNSQVDSLITKAQKEAERVQLAQAKQAEQELKQRLQAQEQLYREYGTAQERIALDLRDKLQTIETSGFDEEKKQSLREQAQRDADIELAIYQETLDKKVDALDEWQKTERQKLMDARNNARFGALVDPELRKAENEEYLQYALNAADREYEHKISLLNLAQEKETLSLFEYASTDRRMFEEGWRLKIAEAELMTDELRDIRIQAYKEEYAKDLELFNLNEQKKVLSLKENSMGKGEFMLANQQLDIAGIMSQNLPPEQRALEIAKAKQPLSEAMQGVSDSLNPQSPLEKLRQEYEANLEIVDAYESQWTNLLGVHSQERVELTRQYETAKAQIMLGESEALFGSLASASKDLLGEQSSTYRTMFAMQKSFVMASAGINMYKAISDMMADGITLPEKLGKAAVVASEFATIISAASSITMQGFERGGYTGNVGTKDVAGVVHGQEYVFDAKATKRIGVDNLERMRSGKSIGGGDVNISVTVDAKGNSSVSGDNDKMGRQMAQGIKAVVMDTLRKEKRQGGMLYA